MVFDLLITFFLFAITVVMLAGAGSLLQQWLDLPEVWGSVLATIATVLIVCLDVRQVIAFIGAVTPLLVFLTVVVAAYVVSTRTPATTCCWPPRNSSRAASQWLVAAFLYVSYNIVAGMPFLVIMGGQASSRRNALWGGVLGGVLLGILMLLIGAAMYLRIDTLGGVSMPMLALATQISPGLGHLMSLAIFGMILNTAVGMLYAFVARILPAGGAPFRLGTSVAGIAALAGSFVGFIKLVGVVYPIYGYIGFLLMGCTLVCWLRSARPRAMHEAGAPSARQAPASPAGHTVFDTLRARTGYRHGAQDRIATVFNRPRNARCFVPESPWIISSNASAARCPTPTACGRWPCPKDA